MRIQSPEILIHSFLVSDPDLYGYLMKTDPQSCYLEMFGWKSHPKSRRRFGTNNQESISQNVTDNNYNFEKKNLNCRTNIK